MQEIVGVIPAAGKGRRLAPLPVSKELFPVGWQQMLIDGTWQQRPKVVSQYLLETMVAGGVHKIFIILGEGKHDIMQYYGDGSRVGATISYLYQEELKGMPFALNLVKPWLRGETVAFGMPDTIIEPQDAFRRLLESHFASDADVTLGAFRTDNPSKFGMVEFDEDDWLVRCVDKPQHTTLEYLWGIACWSPSFVELMDAFLHERPYRGTEIVLSDVFQHAVDQGLRIKILRFDHGSYIDIGTPSDLDGAMEKYGIVPTRGQ